MLNMRNAIILGSGSRRPRLASEFNEEGLISSSKITLILLTEWKVSACLKYLLYFESNGLKYCATVLNIKTAITCSHCLSKEAKPGDPIVLHDQDGKTYQASLMYINKAFDIAFLSLTESTGFGIEPLSPGGAYTGAPYMAFVSYISNQMYFQDFRGIHSILRLERKAKIRA